MSKPALEFTQPQIIGYCGYFPVVTLSGTEDNHSFDLAPRLRKNEWCHFYTSSPTRMPSWRGQGKFLLLCLPWFFLEVIFQFYEHGGSNTSRFGTHGDSSRKAEAKRFSHLLASKHKKNVELTRTHGTKTSNILLPSPYDTFPTTFFLLVVTNLEPLREHFNPYFKKIQLGKKLNFWHNFFTLSKKLLIWTVLNAEESMLWNPQRRITCL